MKSRQEYRADTVHFDSLLSRILSITVGLIEFVLRGDVARRKAGYKC